MTNFDDVVVEEVFPVGGELRKLNFGHSPASVIPLSECPLKVVCEIQVPKMSSSIVVMGDRLSGLKTTTVL